MNQEKLLSDSLYHLKEAFQYNEPIYHRMTIWFYVAYFSVSIMTISYIILIISLQLI